MFYTIGEMAQKLNVAPSTLRYYDKEGLLPFVERSSGGGYGVAADAGLSEKGGDAPEGDQILYGLVPPGGRHHRPAAGPD